MRKKKRFLRSLENRKLQQVRFKQDDIVDRFLKRDAQPPEAELVQQFEEYKPPVAVSEAALKAKEYLKNEADLAGLLEDKYTDARDWMREELNIGKQWSVENKLAGDFAKALMMKQGLLKVSVKKAVVQQAPEMNDGNKRLKLGSFMENMGSVDRRLRDALHTSRHRIDRYLREKAAEAEVLNREQRKGGNSCA